MGIRQFQRAEVCGHLTQVIVGQMLDQVRHLRVTAPPVTEIEQLGGGSNSGLGTGGMSAKLTAAKIATGAGVDMVIANGANANVLYDIVDGKDVGTRFVGKNNK